MPFVPRALYEVMTALVADMAAGKIVRLPDVPKARTGELVTQLHATTRPQGPMPLPPSVESACRRYGRNPKAYAANVEKAHEWLRAGKQAEEITALIEAGA